MYKALFAIRDVRKECVKMHEIEKIGIGSIKGIGPKSEALFNKMGIYTVVDLLNYYPRDYDVYELPVPIGLLEEGRMMAVRGVIVGNITVTNNARLPMTQVMLKSDDSILKLIWFRAPYIKSMLRTGQTLIVRGKVSYKNQQYQMEHPELFVEESTYYSRVGTLQPRYTLTKGITNNLITKSVISAMNVHREYLAEVFEEQTLQNYKLCGIQHALQGIHFPVDKEEFIEARRRLVFEEFITFILSLRALKEEVIEEVNGFCVLDTALSDNLIKALPYQLTAAQIKVWEEIKKDIGNPKKNMSRLIQGDVGSGKTIVAVLSLIVMAAKGYQGALMAPTEVLAKQHFQSITELFEDYDIPFQVEVLTGSMTAKEKRLAYARIEDGESQIIIGTHALIQGKVNYHNLGLVITDEQHRFGVKQREQLSDKGCKPHVLVMSATPIPRTLAIILYGDLDISIIDELPANRLPIKNCVVGTDYQPTAYKFMKAQVKEGRQCYVICPMVEESEHLDGENVIDYSRKLQDILGTEIRVAYLHGKMKQSQKDEIMESYYARNIDVLVSTTVIEVGINVPNASTMLIENAERFGLSGLHQLRGRVGRGVHQSYCIFMTATKSKETKARLDILAKSNDGFHIANEDLKLRGPGDLFGIRQSGDMNFRMADIIQDAKILQLASEAVYELCAQEVEHILKKDKNKSIIL